MTNRRASRATALLLVIIISVPSVFMIHANYFSSELLSYVHEEIIPDTFYPTPSPNVPFTQNALDMTNVMNMYFPIGERTTPPSIYLFDISVQTIVAMLQRPQADKLRSDMEIFIENLFNIERVITPFELNAIPNEPVNFYEPNSIISFNYDNNMDFFVGMFVLDLLRRPGHMRPLEESTDDWIDRLISFLEKVFNAVEIYSKDDLLKITEYCIRLSPI